MIFQLILIVLAFVLFLLAAIGVPAGRFNLVAAGLACLAFAHLVAYSGGAKFLP